VFAVPQGISIREFARRDGCSGTLARRGVKTGHLTAFSDGTLDPAVVGTGWRKGNRDGANVFAPEVRSAHPAVAARDDETPAQAAERIVSSDARYSQAEAERVKENYLALLRQLEYDLNSGLVVPVEDVAAVVDADYAKVRTRLLAIPSEQAPRLHRLRTVAELQDALLAIIIEALEELSRGGDGPGS
jgi:hypothetical protein